MSSLYRARVDRVTPPKARLTVWQIHPDAGVPPESVTFALALLCAPFRKPLVLEGAAPSLRSPLAKAIDIASSQDADDSWMIENARAFIASVSRKAVKNARPKASLEWPSSYGGDLSPLPQAVFEIVATDPAWVSHLEPGLSWRTAAFDMGKARPASPRHPGDDSSKKSPRPSAARRLELIRGSSRKFWEIQLQGKTVVTRYGRIGAAPRVTKNFLSNREDAQRTFDKLLASKTAKGYREV